MLKRLHYVSPKGSAELLAARIGQDADVIKEALPPAYMPENIALLFLGCEGSKADKTTMEFINMLNPQRVTYAALYCCNPKKSDAPIQQMKAALTAQGIKVLDDAYVCSGKGGLFGGKHPTDEEIKGAAKWAAECAKKVSQ